METLNRCYVISPLGNSVLAKIQQGIEQLIYGVADRRVVEIDDEYCIELSRLGDSMMAHILYYERRVSRIYDSFLMMYGIRLVVDARALMRVYNEYRQSFIDEMNTMNSIGFVFDNSDTRSFTMRLDLDSRYTIRASMGYMGVPYVRMNIGEVDWLYVNEPSIVRAIERFMSNEHPNQVVEPSRYFDMMPCALLDWAIKHSDVSRNE